MTESSVWLPKGEQGDPGPQGPEGPPGPQGPQGGPGPDAAAFVAFVNDLANVANPAKGTAMVGRSIQVVDTIAQLKLLLKTSVSKTAYTRGYYTLGDGGGSFYYLDEADTTTADNNGTVIVAADGGRWKMLHNGTVNIKQFGLVADWNGTTGTDNTARMAAMFADSKIAKITGAAGDYFFSLMAGNTRKFTISRPLHMALHGVNIKTGESNPAGSFTSTSFWSIVDTGDVVIEGFTFDDTTYANANNSRGIQPITILSTVPGITRNFAFGNYRVIRGQSLLTVGSTLPLTARAKNISFFGSVAGLDTYYGVNLASNGDDFHGEYSVDIFNRSIFIYDVNGVKANIHAGTGNASSANVLISNKGVLPTENVDIKVVLESLNGRIDVEGLVADPSPLRFNNINLDVFVKNIGSNILVSNPPVTIGMLDASSNWAASGTYEVTGLSVKFRSPLRFAEGVRVMTAGAGVGKIEVDTDRIFATVLNNRGIYWGRGAGRYVIAGSGDLGATPVAVDVSKVYGAVGPQNLFLTARVVSYNGAVTNSIVAEYRIRATMSAGGLYTIVGATQLSQQQSGTYNPVLTVTAPSPFNAILFGASSGGAAGASTEVTFWIDEA